MGREVAEKIYERHCFFTEQLIAAGVDPKTPEADACLLYTSVNAGKITIGGTDVRDFKLDSLMKNISMVFQSVYLLSLIHI